MLTWRQPGKTAVPRCRTFPEKHQSLTKLRRGRPQNGCGVGVPRLPQSVGKLVAFMMIINLEEFVSMRLRLPEIAIKIVEVGHRVSLHPVAGTSDGRVRACGVSSLARATGPAQAPQDKETDR